MSGRIRHALVFGASGLIGRHLILELHEAGARISTANRSATAYQRLRTWLADHGMAKAPTDFRVDFDADGLLAGETADWADTNEIYNCAGAYRFGMGVEEARRANVGSVEAILNFAGRLPNLHRIVHVSGYRVGGQDPGLVPWGRKRVERTYQRLGAYEASKVEADAVFQAMAQAMNIPWSVVNPSSVIGDSKTGETDQFLGLAASVKDIWQGAMSILPGNSRTFVPIVTADYLARFMSLLPIDETTAGKSYWVLDDNTPALADLLTHIGRHYQVKVPKARIPIAIIKRLPRSITKADPESLSFLSSDRYPTDPAIAFAKRNGLEMPNTMDVILRWADCLKANRFGEARMRPICAKQGVWTLD